ncbi:hypothetical protein [Capnocytophaga gingivalis]|jgi:hypothetical protein|uniref:hypothetical protein n=1 Tax=Capnocytophaga gingivalis TaxID=1017 RepID=UPI0023F6BCB4|nr:hypothetical protein [Capnocytophaga gingivalis]
MQSLFPVQALNRNITEILKKIISADILGNVNKGLNNNIEFIDVGTALSNVAEIAKNTTDDTSKVTISAAYCQYLWLMCSITIMKIDREVIAKACEHSEISLKKFLEDTMSIINKPKEQIKKELQLKGYYNIDVEKYIEYLKTTPELLEEEGYLRRQKYYINLLCELTDKEKFDINHFSKIDMKTPYAEKINSVYCFGICFILLHELSHFSLGHLDKNGQSIQDEIDADFDSFWSIYSDISKDEKFSANCGILCALFSLLFLNPTMESDGIHPSEEDRIIAIYDNIKSDNPKYTILLVSLFTYWAKFHNIRNFPKDLQEEEPIDKIKSFLSNYKKNNNIN